MCYYKKIWYELQINPCIIACLKRIFANCESNTENSCLTGFEHDEAILSWLTAQKFNSFFSQNISIPLDISVYDKANKILAMFWFQAHSRLIDQWEQFWVNKQHTHIRNINRFNSIRPPKQNSAYPTKSRCVFWCKIKEPNLKVKFAVRLWWIWPFDNKYQSVRICCSNHIASKKGYVFRTKA